MCRHFGVDDLSSTNVAQGREVLPTNVKPVHYDLTLEPDFDKFTYNGTVTIEYVRLLLQYHHAAYLLTRLPVWKSPTTLPP